MKSWCEWTRAAGDDPTELDAPSHFLQPIAGTGVFANGGEVIILRRRRCPFAEHNGSNMDVRAGAEADIQHLAMLWHDGWHDAHAQIVPAELTSLRTVENFAERLQAALSDVRVSGPFGAPTGFHMVKNDELYQLYVSTQSRGTGVAAALIADAEAKLAERGVEMAWLACAIGNERAARFYEKCGWQRTETVIVNLETPQGTFPLEVWRYQKSITLPACSPALTKPHD